MMAEGLVDIGTVAEHFQVSISTVRSWIRESQIPKDTYMKLGKTYRFKLSRLEQALLDSKQDTETVEAPLDAHVDY
jgi:DNA-binding transcriptional MerR regulator|tara:strand:+ start:219 stop:446 length:228 start_codon:yes stop_codon:yes gene_type:complete